MIVGNYKAKYLGKTMCGFERLNEYEIEVEKGLYGYLVQGLKRFEPGDDTDDLNVEHLSSAAINYASEKSLRRNWDIHEDTTSIHLTENNSEKSN